jgi:hypothetical protein
MVRRGLLGLALGGLSIVVVACASLAGLDSYKEGEAPAGDAGRKDVGTASDVTMPPSCDDGSCTPEASEGCEGATCDAETPPIGTYVCGAGGCNAAGGACSAQGQACFCTSDTLCPSGKCVKTAGKNDVSCTACTGSGPADGFGCQLGAPGIPASCAATFGYTPSNLSSQQLAALAPVGPVALTCAGTVTYDGTSWTGSTCSQTLPAAKTLTQSGGPSIDVLAFDGLTIGAGVTLNLTGSNAVVIVVFGDATVSGSIHADGTTGASNSSTAGASGPGGNYNCGSGTGGNGMGAAGTCSSPFNSDPCRNAGGGGGGANTKGGAGNAGLGGTGGTGGNSRTNASLVPLYGGCPGGDSAGYACTTSGGGGGGALQISALGTLTISAGASVTASGGGGGTSSCSSGFGGTGNPYPGGGGGGGAGGAVLLEGQTVTQSGTVAVNGANGGDAQAGGGHAPGSTSASNAGGAGNLSVPPPNPPYAGGGGGGGGGGYGYTRINGSRTAATYSCATTLSPAPVCLSDHSACVCVADTDCPTGKCVGSGQCTGTCTGAGAADSTRCALATASMPVDAGSTDGGAVDSGEAGPGDASADR